jgi:NADH-quinone oxidoreductase subunit L
MNFEYTIWILLLPFLAFVINGLGSKKVGSAAAWISIIGMGIGTILSLTAAYQYFTKESDITRFYPYNISWLQFTDSLSINMGILVDPISVMMMVVITVVSLMVFVYSVGYMGNDSGYARYFSFISLFSFSMLGLVVATNLFQMYIFWELVGVSSYLLIGFYYTKTSAVAAAKKAFIVTRFADLGFLLGILFLSYDTGTFSFEILINPEEFSLLSTPVAGFLGLSVTTWALILIFIGGAGKSAMFPLHIWLPDAMEGPTPVSALIHAATMVVAGVYLVARMFSLYALHAPAALDVVAFIGIFTALFAAVIACTQTDIKRILAFSTMSQIGYMMMALGIATYGGEGGLGYTASLFHLFTHAFFKALLFLGAGSVIHAVHTNNIFEMGGLRKHQPVTHIVFLTACLAIAGIPPFAGFFSKDEILAAAFMNNSIYYVVGTLVAGLTAFYMFRLYFIVFWGKEKSYENRPHESPNIMLIPMIVLAIGSALAGFVPFGKFISTDGVPFEPHINWTVAAISVGIALAGIITAFLLYRKESLVPDKIKRTLGGFYSAANKKFFIDEVYLFITRKIIFNLVSRPIAWFDRNIVDGFMNAVGSSTNSISEDIKEFQSGQLQKYAFIFLSGILLILLTFIYLNQ